MAKRKTKPPESATHLVVVSHTHWDREWYRPFEAFRHRLVRLVDTLLDILDTDPSYIFHFDGQTIVLDDYTAIRPQNEVRLRGHLESGRIRIGPWRVLPDQFLVTGESLIRNLRQGHQDCARWGVAPSPVGYAPDMFGHTAIMPQIFAGFGIDSAVVWRGVGPDVQDTRFIWQSPDGTEAFAIYLADSYSNGANLPTSQEALLARLDEIRAAQEGFCHIQPILVMNGSDHLEPQPQIPASMDEAVANREGWSWEMASLEDFVAQAREDTTNLTRHVGELRHPWRANILPGVTSVRSYQKQADFVAARLLEKYVEPLTAWASLADRDHGSADFLEYAWRLLIENHPHDSICGCSVDAVHNEVDTRYEKVSQLGHSMQQEALQQLAATTDTQAIAPVFDNAILTYSPARPTEQLLDTTVYLTDPESFSALQDASGQLHPLQLTPMTGELFFEVNLPADALKLMVAGMEDRNVMDYVMNDLFMERNGRHLKLTVICAHHTHGNVDVEAKKRDLIELLERENIETVRVVGQPATKARLQALLPVGGQTAIDGFAQTGRTPPADTGMLAVGERRIESDAFIVEVDDDASVSLIDKRTRHVWHRVLRLVDEGDRGDTYNFDPVAAGEIIETPAVPVRCTVIAEGPVAATIAVETTYAIPEGLGEDRLTRSTSSLDLPVRMELTCYRGLPRIDVCLRLENRCRDHRLRAVVDLPFAPAQSIAEGAFGIVRRSTALPAGADFVEKPCGTAPMKTFVCVEDGTYGMALLNRGIPEYEVSKNGGRGELALTLLRCVGWLSRDDLEMRNRNGAGPSLATPGAQSLRTQEFEFSLMPYAGSFDAAQVCAQAHAYAYPPIATQTDRHRGKLPAGSRLVEARHPDMVVSAATLSSNREDLSIRLYNTAETPVKGSVKFLEGAGTAAETNFLDQPVGKAKHADGSEIKTELTPSQIRTWLVGRSGNGES